MSDVIEVTTTEALAAYKAVKRINDENRFGGKAVWAMVDFLHEMENIAKTFDATQTALFKSRGGVAVNGSVVVRNPEREENESDEAYAARLKQHQIDVVDLYKEIEELGSKIVTFPKSKLLKRSLFESDKDELKYSANDLACLMKFFI